MKDTIYREDAIGACAYETIECYEARKAIRNLPSADRPQGEWIEVESYEYETHSVTDMRCNLCGKYSQMVLPFQTKCVYPRCPFCGAKMKGADNETD